LCMVHAGYYFLFRCPIFFRKSFAVNFHFFSRIQKGSAFRGYINWYKREIGCLVCSKAFLHHDRHLFGILKMETWRRTMLVYT
jgi:hypothetical protein